MRRIIFSLMLIGPFGANAATPPIYYFDTAHTTEKSVFDNKGKLIATQRYKATTVKQEGGRCEAIGSNITIKDGKEREITTCHFTFNGSTLMIGMGEDAAGNQVWLDYPQAGKNIKCSALFSTKARFLGKEINISVTITERKILNSKESVSTAAGTFDCIKSSYWMELRSKVLGIGISVNVYVIEWYAPGTGIVRTDIFRNYKLHEKRELTKRSG